MRWTETKKQIRSRAIETGTGVIQQSRNAGSPKQGEPLTETVKMPTFGGQYPHRKVQSSKMAQGLTRTLRPI
jgi:hypothetical protein